MVKMGYFMYQKSLNLNKKLAEVLKNNPNFQS